MQIFGGMGVGGANKVHCGICASGLSSPQKRVSRQTSQGPNKYFRNPNESFRVSLFHMRPRTVLKACKIIKINRLNCFAFHVHTSHQPEQHGGFGFASKVIKARLVLCPNKIAMLRRLTNHQTSSVGYVRKRVSMGWQL